MSKESSKVPFLGEICVCRLDMDSQLVLFFFLFIFFIFRWFGMCWFVHDMLKYEFDLEFEVCVPPSPPLTSWF